MTSMELPFTVRRNPRVSSSASFLAEISVRSPRKLIFLLPKQMFSGSKCPQNVLFIFENSSTGFKGTSVRGWSEALYFYRNDNRCILLLLLHHTWGPVLLFSPKYRLVHPENYLFLLSIILFSLRSKYPKHVLFDFENRSTDGDGTCGALISSNAVLAEIPLRSPPQKYLFLLSKKLFVGSKYPKRK